MCDVCDRNGTGEVKETPVINMVVYSALQCGIGYNGLHNFLGNLSMKPLLKIYGGYAKTVVEATVKKTMNILEGSVSAVIKKHYLEKLKVTPDGHGVFDIRVLFDGSWQKRGHTSLLGIGAIIEAETNLISYRNRL